MTPQAEAAYFNPLAYSYFSPAAAVLISFFLVWCIWKRWHAAFGIALICWWGLGSAGIGPLHYSYVLYSTSILVVVRMGWEWMQSGQRFVTRPGLMAGVAKFLFALLTVIWLKAGFDTLALGWDEARSDAYYALSMFALPGAVVVVLAFAVQPWRLVVRHLFLSALVIGGIYFAFGVIAAVAFEPALLFFSGAGRMTLHNLDTINAVRFAPLLMLALLYVVLLRPSAQRMFFAVAGWGALMLVLVLVGTRQIAVSVCLVTACSLLVLNRKLIGMGLLACTLLLGFLTVNSDWIKYTPLMARMEAASEMADGRREIWENAYEFTMAQPLTGGGFRSFGSYNMSVNPETGVVTVGRDNAHGLFQDCFTDHGVVLGGLLLLGSVGAALHGFYLASRSPEPEAKAAGLMPIALWSSLLFSGALYSAWGFYLGLVVYAGVAAGLRGDRARPLVPMSRSDHRPAAQRLGRLVAR